MTVVLKEPAIRVVAMPADTNPDGDIFGGWIMSMMDLAAFVACRKIVPHKMATVAVNNLVFHNPVFVGDCVECFTEIEKVGNTSVTVNVQAFVIRRDALPGEDKLKVTEGRFVFVAIDKDRKPIPVSSPRSL